MSTVHRCRIAAGRLVAIGAMVALSVGSPLWADEPVAVKMPAAVSNYDIPQVEFINQKIRQGWRDFEIQPSEPASEEEWCRRVHLDVIGRIPSYTELKTFLDDYSPDKKAKLVNRLLSEEYAEEYARNWTTIWTNLLIGRSGGADRDSMANRPGMQQYLRRSFGRNKPFDQMAHELISASGVNKPGSPDFNGAANYLADKMAEDGVLATSKTSELFMGIRVQCTQCHDHPFNSWKQNQFWEMNAFFRQTRPLRRYEGGQDVQFIELVDEDFAGEGGNPNDAEIYYEQRNGVLKVAYPVFTDVDGTQTELGKSGFVEDVNRREELAKLIVNSGYMPQAIVNRMWGHFLGYGFTKPVDDMGPHNPPTHPELLERLGEEFRAGNYDLKNLIRWIALSEPYSLSSKFHSGNKRDDPTLGEKPIFSRFYLRQMSAEQLYESLLVATQAHKTRGSYEEQEDAKSQWLQQFTIAFGTDENDEATTFNGTIPQVLMMFNGDLIKKATSAEKGSFLEKVAATPGATRSQKIEYLYMAALSRKPTSSETRLVAKLFAGGNVDVKAAAQDLWWALLNTNEFILIH